MSYGEEVKEYFDKYFNGEFTDVLCPKNGSFNYGCLFDKFLKSTIIDCPDMFFVDEKTKTIYIFEHFQIDSSKHTKKGSQSKAEIAVDNKKFEEKAALCSPTNPEVEYSSSLKIQSSVKYYFDSLKQSFDKHKSSVNEYKDHVLKITHNNQNDWNFFITFVIEDGSVFGSICYDKKLLFPTTIKEFMDIFRSQNDVDCLICSNFFNELRCTWAISKEDQNKMCCNEKELSQIELVEFNPQTLGFSLFIPKEKIK